MLTRSKVRQRLGISKDEFLRLIRSGQLPAIRTGSGPKSWYRVSEADLEAYIESRRVIPTERAS